MRRKYRRADLARDLDRSPAWVSKYAGRGMPTHDATAAVQWCRTHLHPSWCRPFPGEAAPRQTAPALADVVADLLADAGEEIIANLHFELGTPLDSGEVAFSVVACALGDALERQGYANELWAVASPLSRIRDDDDIGPARARIEARVAQLRAEFPDDEDDDE